MAHTYTLTVAVTDNQKKLLDRWFPRWNATLSTPYATIEDAFIGILRDNVKIFISEENLLNISGLEEALRAAPDDVQDEVLDKLGPYLP